jgi:hypothetical protein
VTGGRLIAASTVSPWYVAGQRPPGPDPEYDNTDRAGSMYRTYGKITAAAKADVTRKARVIRWPGFRIPGP